MDDYVVQTFETTAMVLLESVESLRLPGLLILGGVCLILFLTRACLPAADT